MFVLFVLRCSCLESCFERPTDGMCVQANADERFSLSAGLFQYSSLKHLLSPRPSHITSMELHLLLLLLLLLGFVLKGVEKKQRKKKQPTCFLFFPLRYPKPAREWTSRSWIKEHNDMPSAAAQSHLGLIIQQKTHGNALMCAGFRCLFHVLLSGVKPPPRWIRKNTTIICIFTRSLDAGNTAAAAAERKHYGSPTSPSAPPPLPPDEGFCCFSVRSRRKTRPSASSRLPLIAAAALLLEMVGPGAAATSGTGTE